MLQLLVVISLIKLPKIVDNLKTSKLGCFHVVDSLVLIDLRKSEYKIIFINARPDVTYSVNE